MSLISRIKKKIKTVSKRTFINWKEELKLEMQLLLSKPDAETVYCILDDFTYSCFKYEFNLVQLSANKWRKQFEHQKPKFFFCESAWEANNGQWRGAFNDKKSPKYQLLLEVLSYCNKHNIKTVFWNKEDPPNFEHFVDMASKFDVIYTTEERLVEEYKKRAPKAHVSSMMFGAQPLIHNAVDAKKNDFVCFAGAWRGIKYPARAVELERMIDTVSKTDKVIIYDRDFHKPHAKNRFPEKYKSIVNPPISYEVLSHEYRNFKAMINVNSVSDSQTMCARRIFEILSSRTVLLTSYSPAVTTIFGNNVYMEGVGAGINGYFSDSEIERSRKTHLNYRKVLADHTYAQRAQKIKKDLGFQDTTTSIHVQVVVGDIPLNKVLDLYGQFKAQNYSNKSFVYLGKNEEVKQALSGEKFRTEILSGEDSYTTDFDPAYLYGVNYLTDMMLNLQIGLNLKLGKTSYYVYHLPTNSLYIRKPSSAFKTINSNEDGIMVVKNSSAGKQTFLSVDPYNLLKISESIPNDCELVMACSLEEAKKLVFI